MVTETHNTRPLHDTCGGELVLVQNQNGDLYEHPQRPGFFLIQCEQCEMQGGTSNPELIRLARRVTQRFVILPPAEARP